MIQPQRSRRYAEGAVDENEVGEKLLACALTVHRTLGPGLLENASDEEPISAYLRDLRG
jgi:hypothetical protein